MTNKMRFLEKNEYFITLTSITNGIKIKSYNKLKTIKVF